MGLLSRVNFCGLDFNALNRRELLNSDSSQILFVVTVNAEFIVEAQRDAEFKAIIDQNLSTFDGQIPYLLARVLRPNVKIDKISGSDLLFDVIARCKETHESLFLLGADADTNSRAVLRAKELGALNTFGFSPAPAPYPFGSELEHEILEKINEIRPDYLFVGFGARKQEFWIRDNLEKLKQAGVKFVVGSGGSFAFLAGSIKRAPYWMQRVGLEGVYRFVQEPRLFRLMRIIKSLGVFLYVFK